MILNSQPKQLRLQDDGQILWQKDATNPLPGVPVAVIKKGSSALTPGIELIESEALEGQDRDEVSIFVKNWLGQYIMATLEKLVGLNADGLEGPVKEIAQKIYLALGIIPRSEIETEIAALDPEMRKVLRQRHVRLGPILVFVPELSKPAAVRLRALLWWLWNDRQLPAPVPKDGVVSVIVDEAQIDPLYQRAIGYPVYGSRAIRVDMLDRLICAIYDNAKDGKFKATHKMAEWLGSSIPDMYKVLEAMGHKKLEEAAAEAPKSVETTAAEPSAEAAPAEAVAAVEVSAETPVAEVAAETSAESATAETPAAEAPAVETPVVAAVAAKPDLATFRLKRGKAGEAEKARGARGPRRAPKAKTPPPFEKLTEEEMAAIRERDKKREEEKAQRKSKDDRPKDARPRDRKPRDDRRGRDGDNRQDKIVLEIHAPKTGDSPFAMLQQLKVARKD